MNAKEALLDLPAGNGRSHVQCRHLDAKAWMRSLVIVLLSPVLVGSQERRDLEPASHGEQMPRNWASFRYMAPLLTASAPLVWAQATQVVLAAARPYWLLKNTICTRPPAGTSECTLLLLIYLARAGATVYDMIPVNLRLAGSWDLNVPADPESRVMNPSVWGHTNLYWSEDLGQASSGPPVGPLDFSTSS
ncbi:hypothetical protein CERZMDRAFT_102846 [Cercospora zeae-maydis SCOH1-5]|uniref:Uncharacterized protein n=1 Tax=Cercospora zeae-maydis SCOH1-5 TaxID=717836 RepID=A0A6A6F172_9PEZI|nr:hypothetical protein CERZMDRAFT_102846 [Cercospora zeae-maydis SCOH1-5]